MRTWSSRACNTNVAHPGDSADAQLAVAPISLAAVVAFVISSVPSWRPLLAHVQVAPSGASE